MSRDFNGNGIVGRRKADMAHRTPAIYARRSAKGWAGWEYSKAQWPHRYGFDDPGKVAFRLCKTREPAHQFCLYLGSFPHMVPSLVPNRGSRPWPGPARHRTVKQIGPLVTDT